MTTDEKVSASHIRRRFSAAMSDMYRREVPAYGVLMELVDDVNRETLEIDPDLRERLEATDTLARVSDERHGAIRLGKPDELAMMRRVFAVMGMAPVGYYDLSEAGVPVHATAFRPIDGDALRQNPFRVFTSLLRLDLIKDDELRRQASEILSERRIFTDRAVELIGQAERDGGLTDSDANAFVNEVLETFRWHRNAQVDVTMYHRFHDAHRLIADVVSFKGPHINHLTPRTLDIDKIQAHMPNRGITPKAFVEGPPPRRCPILLRQTSFKALEEEVLFRTPDGGFQRGSHTARFGEIEQRGIALTPKGRALYDELLAETRSRIRPAADGSNAKEYVSTLASVFERFPDDWSRLRSEGLGYFEYSLTPKGREHGGESLDDLESAISNGFVRFDPIVYEDFLPVSAAGIFQSNLGDGAQQDIEASPSQKRFETELGGPVLNEFEHYQKLEQRSIEAIQESSR